MKIMKKTTFSFVLLSSHYILIIIVIKIEMRNLYESDESVVVFFMISQKFLLPGTYCFVLPNEFVKNLKRLHLFDEKEEQIAPPYDPFQPGSHDNVRIIIYE